MRGKEYSAQQDAETAHDNVRNAEERILATHDGAGRDENGLCALVLLNGVA